MTINVIPHTDQCIQDQYFKNFFFKKQKNALKLNAVFFWEKHQTLLFIQVIKHITRPTTSFLLQRSLQTENC